MDAVIIGSGNTATVLARLMKKNHHTILQIISRHIENAQQLATEINCNFANDISAINKSATIYIIAVSDSVIERIASKIKLEEKLIVHTCGAINKNVLNPTSVNYGVLYPLQSLRKENPHTPAIPFLIDGNNAHAKKEIFAFAKTLSSFVTDAAAGTGSFATSKVTLTNLAGLSVTQDYRVAATTSALFEDKVTITNTTGSDIANLRYVRDMDWDVPPTEFSELVTIGGVKTTSFLELSHDNGFSDPNPLASTSPLITATLNTDFTDNGPTDHGAYFKFNFGALAAGDSRSFSIFYGATPDEAAANAALAASGIELYSFGQSNGNGITGTPQTYVFGFAGVGGTAVIPPTGDPTAVPEPFTIVGTLMGAATAFRMRKRLKVMNKL